MATLLSTKQVLERTRLPRSTFYDMRADGRFPRPIKLDGVDHAVAYLASDVDAWLQLNPRAPRR